MKVIAIKVMVTIQPKTGKIETPFRVKFIWYAMRIVEYNGHNTSEKPQNSVETAFTYQTACLQKARSSFFH
jgi:hypothetical protein